MQRGIPIGRGPHAQRPKTAKKTDSLMSMQVPASHDGRSAVYPSRKPPGMSSNRVVDPSASLQRDLNRIEARIACSVEGPRRTPEDVKRSAMVAIASGSKATEIALASPTKQLGPDTGTRAVLENPTERENSITPVDSGHMVSSFKQRCAQDASSVNGRQGTTGSGSGANPATRTRRVAAKHRQLGAH